jgi:hypothetical protein
MIRIIGTAPEFGAPLQDLHPLVDYQCCAAATHLQHEARFPTSRIARWWEFRTWLTFTSVTSLFSQTFADWHGSCSMTSTKILPTE